MNKFYIYVFVDHDTGNPVYIGKGARDRDFQHRRNAKNGVCSHLYHWMRKYKNRNGVWPKPFRLKEGLAEKEAFELEKSLISLYGRLDIGTGCLFNHTDGGEGKGRIAWNKGIPCADETKQKISRAQKGISRPLAGQRSAEARKKMSLAQKGRILSEGHKAKISESLLSFHEKQRKIITNNVEMYTYPH